MWNIRTNTAALLLLTTGLVVAARGHCAAAELDAISTDRTKANVVIVLRPKVQTDSRVIRMVDVASITGGDPLLREQIKQLDIEDALSPGESVTILSPQIEFRLLVARVDIDRVSIRGQATNVTAKTENSLRDRETVTNVGAAASTWSQMAKSRRTVDFSSISVDEGPLEREIVQTAKNCLLNKLPWPAECVDIRLAQPIPADVRQVGSIAGYEFSAELRTPGPAVGRVQVRVIAQAARKPSFDVTVMLDVRHFEKVVLATKAIERGRVIVATDLYLDRQDVTDLTDYCSAADTLIGTKAKRSIRALLPVRKNDVEEQTRPETTILIKRREQVKMTARIGALDVSATGEALQDGRMGDVIRIRNIESNANVQGRVTGLGEVEISF